MLAFVDPIFVLRSLSNPDITDNAMTGAPVPRKHAEIYRAENREAGEQRAQQ